LILRQESPSSVALLHEDTSFLSLVDSGMKLWRLLLSKSTPLLSHTAALSRACTRPADAAEDDANSAESFDFSCALRSLVYFLGALPSIVLSVASFSPPTLNAVPCLLFSVTFWRIASDAAVERWHTLWRADFGRLLSMGAAGVPSLIL